MKEKEPTTNEKMSNLSTDLAFLRNFQRLNPEMPEEGQTLIAGKINDLQTELEYYQEVVKRPNEGKKQ